MEQVQVAALLLALNANDMHTLLTASSLPAAAHLSIVVVRRLAEDAFYFAVGRSRVRSAIPGGRHDGDGQPR